MLMFQKDLVLPTSTNVQVFKTTVLFSNSQKKAYLKGNTLELDQTIQIKTLSPLGYIIKKYSNRLIKTCHLGTTKFAIPNIKDSVDLEKILTKYFS